MSRGHCTLGPEPFFLATWDNLDLGLSLSPWTPNPQETPVEWGREFILSQAPPRLLFPREQPREARVRGSLPLKTASALLLSEWGQLEWMCSILPTPTAGAATGSDVWSLQEGLTQPFPAWKLHLICHLAFSKVLCWRQQNNNNNKKNNYILQENVICN